LLTVAEAAEYLRVTRHTVYRWIAQGRLRAVRYSPRVLRLRRSDLEQHGVASRSAVGETRAVYSPGRQVSDEEEQQEVRRLLERYRELSNRPRQPGEPPKGSAEALLRHVGVISEETGEELRRVIREAKDASVNDAVWSFDDPS